MIWKPSPNFWKGKNTPKAIVIHIMAGTLRGTDAWFANPNSQVSAHYGIGKRGEVHQYVKETDSAWHGGKRDKKLSFLSFWQNPNNFTIGIEHEGYPQDVWTDEMKQASASLIKEICQRWKIPLDRQHIIGHYEIYSGKLNCPAINKFIIDELIHLAQ